MKKLFLVFAIPFSLALLSHSQTTAGLINISKVPVPQGHYMEEYTYDSPSDPLAWEQINPGLHAAFGSTDELYLRRELPEDPDETAKWMERGWRGERLNTQLLVWSSDTVEQLRLRLSSLRDSQGNEIPEEQFHTSLVRYVLSNYPYNGTAQYCEGPMDSVWLMPDRFEPFERFDLPGKTLRPVWISLDIPSSAKPGTYHGTLEILSSEEPVSLQIELKVQDRVLPGPEDWKFRLDLWQNPWVVAWYYHVEPWSDEHLLLLKKHMKLYADAGGAFITTYAVHSPWSDNSYMIEGGMIEWIKKTDGSWQFDYSIFDQYVDLCMDLGIRRAITIYTPVPWGNRFRYLDERTGNYVYESWPVRSEDFQINWTRFMDDLMVHLTEKNWLGITYLGVNENPLEITLASIRAIRQHSDQWKITYAGDWHPELSALLDDYCTVISSEPTASDITLRRESGFTSSFYVCCTPARPNNFVFSPPVEGRYMGWHAVANAYDGFLRWALDAWPADPLRDARHTLWPAGDCFLIYPGGNSSIRFEKLREGIVDFEKIRILRELAEQSANSQVKALMSELEEHFEAFRLDPDYSKRLYDPAKMESDIRKGEDLIARITDALMP